MSNKPTHYLTIVTGDGDTAIFTRIAPLWLSNSSNTLSGTIPPGITITGRVIVTEARTSSDTAKGGAR